MLNDDGGGEYDLERFLLQVFVAENKLQFSTGLLVTLRSLSFSELYIWIKYFR